MNRAGRIWNMKLVLTVLVLALCIVFLRTDRSGNREDGISLVIGVSFSNLADSWQQQLYLDMKTAVKGEDAVLLTYDAAGSDKEQEQNLLDLQARKIDGLVIVPAADSTLGGQLARLKEAGIPVAVIQTRVKDFKPDIFVYSDNRLAGEIAGSYLARVLGGRGVLMEVAGDPDDPVSSERKIGFRSKVGLFPELEREYLLPGHYSGTFTEKALISNGLITAVPAPDGIFGHTDLMAYGASRAFRQAGQNPVVIGINGLPGAMQGMDLVEKGLISATISYPTGGTMAIDGLISQIMGETYQSEIQIQPVLHTGALSPPYR